MLGPYFPPPFSPPPPSLFSCFVFASRVIFPLPPPSPPLPAETKPRVIPSPFFCVFWPAKFHLKPFLQHVKICIKKSHFISFFSPPPPPLLVGVSTRFPFSPPPFHFTSHNIPDKGCLQNCTMEWGSGWASSLSFFLRCGI